MRPSRSLTFLTPDHNRLSFQHQNEGERRLLVSAVDALGDVRILAAHANSEANVGRSVLVSETVNNVRLNLVNHLAVSVERVGHALLANVIESDINNSIDLIELLALQQSLESG